jgi:hypothetical protein
MKYLFLLLISLTASASNWAPLSKIQSASPQAYQLESECLKTGEQCFDIGDTPEKVSLGFASIVNNQLVFDEPSYQAYQSQKAAKAQLEAALAFAQSLRDCGGRVMDLMLVRNQPKGLTIPQVGALLATYAPIQLQLSSGSLQTAKAAISLVQADGIVVTEADKTALIGEIDFCLGGN